jgi:hypothetical protein
MPGYTSDVMQNPLPRNAWRVESIEAGNMFDDDRHFTVHGDFMTLQDAVVCAKTVVVTSLEYLATHHRKPIEQLDGEALLGSFQAYGDVPLIFAPKGGERDDFNPFSFAQEMIPRVLDFHRGASTN